MNILERSRMTLIVSDMGNSLTWFVVDRAAVIARSVVPSHTEIRQILAEGKKHGAKAVLFLHFAEIRELEVKLDANMDEEDRHAAVEFAAERSDTEPGTHRFSYLAGSFGDCRTGVLLSRVAVDDVAGAMAKTQHEHMKFLGIANFKQLLLFRHFSDRELKNDVFLFLAENQGALAYPDHDRIVFRSLPFGIPGEDENEEWAQKAERRLTALKGKSVRLYSPDASEELCERIRTMTNAVSFQPEPWDEALNESAIAFLKSGNSMIVPALPPPKPKDPNHPGTVIALLMIAATVISFLYLTTRNESLKTRYKSELAKNSGISARISSEQAKLMQLEQDLSNEQELFRMMLDKQRVSADYLLVVNLLERYSLQYTRITSIEEYRDGISITGESTWQPDLSRFLSHFEGELSRNKFSFHPDELSKDQDGRITFRAHITAGGK